MRMAIDMDEVLCHFVWPVLERYNRHTGFNITKDDITTWKLSDCLPIDGDEFLLNTMRSSDFYPNQQPIDGAVEGIKQLLKDGHDVIIATAVPKRAPNAWVGKVDWVRNHMPFFDLDNLIGTSRKNLIKADLLFDDGCHNLLDFEGIKVVMGRPWNEFGSRGLDALGDRLKDYMPNHRVHSWKEFMELIDKLSKPTFSFRIG